MKLIRTAIAACLLAAPLSLGACAEQAPELPPNTTVADVSWTPEGNMLLRGYCMTCCGDDWGPGPEISCPSDNTGGGGFPTGSPGNPAGCGGAMNPCMPMPLSDNEP